MTTFVLYTSVVLVAGIVLGETGLVSEIWHGFRAAMGRRRARAEQRAAFPYGRVITRVESQRLEMPAVHRRRAVVPVIRDEQN